MAARPHEGPSKMTTGRASAGVIARIHARFTVWPVGVGGRWYVRRSRSLDLWSPAPRGHPHSSPGTQVLTLDSADGDVVVLSSTTRDPAVFVRLDRPRPIDTTALRIAEALGKGWPVVTYASR